MRTATVGGLTVREPWADGVSNATQLWHELGARHHQCMRTASYVCASMAVPTTGHRLGSTRPNVTALAWSTSDLLAAPPVSFQLIVTTPGPKRARTTMYQEIIAEAPADQDVLVTTRLRRAADRRPGLPLGA